MDDRRYNSLDAFSAFSVGFLVPVFLLVVGGMTVLPDTVTEFSQTVGADQKESFWIPIGASVAVGTVGGLVGYFWYAVTHRRSDEAE